MYILKLQEKDMNNGNTLLLFYIQIKPHSYDINVLLYQYKLPCVLHAWVELLLNAYKCTFKLFLAEGKFENVAGVGKDLLKIDQRK